MTINDDDFLPAIDVASKIKFEKKLLGHIGIDSGLIWIGDPCYQNEEAPNYEEIIREMHGNTDINTQFLNGTCPYKSFNYKLGHEGVGICSANSIGDGVYPVYGIFREKEPRPFKIIIEFE